MVRRTEARQCASTQTRFGLMRLASLHRLCEARRTAASSQGKAVAKPVRPEAMSDRNAWGGWRRNVWKLMHVNQGCLLGCLNEPSRSQSPHSSSEAVNHRGAKGDRKVKSVKATQLQIKLPGVPLAKPGREVDPKWDWTEASVWTARMLATLERGIKGGQTPTLRTSGCSPWPQPERTRADLEGVITNWKAGCGKSARPVWREGWRANAIPTPI
jgi:hypothetical protein